MQADGPLLPTDSMRQAVAHVKQDLSYVPEATHEAVLES